MKKSDVDYHPDKGATFTYSDTGTPLSVGFRSGERTDYVYTADGTKLMTTWGSIRTMLRRKYSLLPNPLINVSIRDTITHLPMGWDKMETFTLLVHSATEYAGPFVIVDGKLDRILFDGGYCTVRDSQPKYHFYVRDHLGSIRVVVDEDGKVEQKTYYYPFGGIYGNVSAGTDVQPFKYNGKELDHRHGLDLYDYGARQYDAATGRWTTMDPLAEKYYSVSPYAYCHNNPVRLIDNHGLEPGDAFSVLDRAALDFGRIYNYWSIYPTTSYPYGREYASVFYSYRDEDNITRYSYYVLPPQDGASATINFDINMIPSNRRSSADFIATGHTHGGYDANSNNPHDGNVFSKADLNSDVALHNLHKSITAGYLATTNGTLMKHWFSNAKKKWYIIRFNNDEYQLPSDANDPSHGAYTFQDINRKFNSLPWYFSLTNSLNDYLEEANYRK